MLVLDAEAPIREMGRRFLQQWGYNAVEADSIDTAIDIVRKTEVIAAILDVRLKGEHSGLDMLAAFRELDEFKTLPILIMTGGVLTKEEEESITKHRAFLFYKPEGFNTIISFLDQLTGRDRNH